MVALLEKLVNIDTGSYDKPRIDQAILLIKEQVDTLVDTLAFNTQVIDFLRRRFHPLI